MKKYILMGMIALSLVCASFAQSGTFNSVKIGGYQVTGVSNDTAIGNQNIAKLLTEAAAKKLVAGRDAAILEGVPKPAGAYWQLQDTGSITAASGIAYGNGIYVAVGYGGFAVGKVATSVDGLYWVERSVSISTQFTSIAYGNGIFVACGGWVGGLYTSVDGITWTSRTIPNYGNNGVARMTFGNGIFVGICGYEATNNPSGSKVITSNDGITWTERVANASNSLINLVFGNGLFVAMSWFGGANAISTSPDGINWTLRTTPIITSTNGSSVIGLIAGKGKFVALGGSTTNSDPTKNILITSNDGFTWTVTGTLPFYLPSVNCSIYANGIYIVSTANSYVYYSKDLVNWLSPSTNKTGLFNLQSVLYVNGRFIASVNAQDRGNKRIMATSEITF